MYSVEPSESFSLVLSPVVGCRHWVIEKRLVACWRGTSMRCSKCGSENPAGKKYCSECGVGLLMRCLRCNAENAPAAKFCGECGAPFESSIGTPVSETGSVQRADLSGERRHLTVLFCDLVGSTVIAARLDPSNGAKRSLAIIGRPPRRSSASRATSPNIWATA